MRVRAWWLLPSFVTGFLLAMWAQEMSLHLRDNELRVSAPQLHFLSGPPLQRLKNGVAVPFDFQMTLWVDNRSTLYDRALQRFVVSYDLWEEKFSVVKQRGFTLRGGSRPPDSARSVAHLSPDAAESWCVDNMSLPVNGVREDQRLWVRMEVRSPDPKEGAPVLGDSGLSLTSLIDLFSRPARAAEQRWTLDAGPVRLADLKRAAARGS